MRLLPTRSAVKSSGFGADYVCRSMKKLKSCVRKAFSCYVPSGGASSPPTNVDVREEYANAFRTESYNEFWAHVLAATNNDIATRRSMDLKSGARLQSYRLFAEHLLDPDQPTVTKLLASVNVYLDNRSLLRDYFLQTSDASLLCGLLLENIEQIRSRHRYFRKTVTSLEPESSSATHPLPVLLAPLTKLTESINPFLSSSPSLVRLRAIQANCSHLLKRLESSRDKARSKTQRVRRFKYGSAVFLVALSASIIFIVVSHGIAMVVAMPAFAAGSIQLSSTKKLDRVSAQLDAAAKGTYTVNRDLETISRALTRLDDELEHMRAMIGLWVELRGGDQVHASLEVARQMEKNDWSFREQLDELEEHLYLCFMTINRARNLVVKQILGFN